MSLTLYRIGIMFALHGPAIGGDLSRPLLFYTIPLRFLNIHSAMIITRNAANAGHRFHSGLGGKASTGTWWPGGRSPNSRSAESKL